MKYVYGLISCVSIALLMMAPWGCSGASKHATAPAGKKDPKSRAYYVRTQSVAARPVDYIIHTTGSVQAQDVYYINAQVAGVVEKLAVKEGTEVTPQTIIAQISPANYKLALEKARTAVTKAKADLTDSERYMRNEIAARQIKLEQAKLEYERRLPVFAAGAIADDEVKLYLSRYDLAKVELKDMQEAIKTQLEVMQAAVREKEADLAIAEENLRKSSVTVPVPGVIEQKLVTDGSYVSAGTALATLVDQRKMRLRFTLPERESAHVAQNTRLTFRVPAYPQRDFKAQVYRIGDVADPAARMVTCWAEIEPADVELKSGFFASVKVIAGQNKKAVVVPITAALPTEDGYVAYVVKDSKAERKTIRLGLHVSGEEVEVLEGLDLGEEVVIEGGNALQPGVEVRLAGGKMGEARPREDAPQTARKPSAGGTAENDGPAKESNRAPDEPAPASNPKG